MRIKYFLIILFVICTSYIAQYDSAKVTIKVISNKLNTSSKVYITGNKSNLGNWQPGNIILDKVKNSWSKTFVFKKTDWIKFKFTQGTWESQALNNDGEIPGNNIINVKNDTTLTYIINYWNKGATKLPTLGQITGRVAYHKQMSFSKLLPRDIIVWLPPGYDNYANQKYPVLYMHDGQNLFDPTTSFNSVDWQMDEAADSLIRKNEIMPLIIVGINNTTERSDEYTPGLTNKLYKTFVVEKLKPFIDSTYRTFTDREHTYVGGSSSGGTISFMFLWEYSNVFSKAACFSPAFRAQYFNYIEEIESSIPPNNFKLYMDNGGLGLETQLQSGIDQMINLLNIKGFKEGKDFWFILDKEAEHNESAWAKRVPNMLKILFPK